MPDMYGNMTPEEERLRLQMQQANVMRGGQARPQMSPNSKAGMMTPEMMQLAARDLSGQQKQAARTQEYGRDLMSAKGPQGIKAGNVYVAPSWTSQLADAVRKGTGAYAAYKGGQKQGELSETQERIDDAKGEIANIQYQVAREDRAEDVGLEREGLVQAAKLAGNKITSQEGIASRGIVADTAADALAETGRNARDVEPVSFFNPNADQPGEPPVLTYSMVGGEIVDNDMNKVNTDGLTPYDATSPQSLTSAEAKAADEASVALAGARSRFPNMDRFISTPLEQANAFTGINPQKWAGKLALGPEGKDAQQFQSILSAEEIGGLIPAIQSAKLTPVSDTDVKVLREKFVNASDQPATIGNFYAYEGRQFMDNTIQNSIKRGDITPAEGQDIQQEYDKKAATLALNWGLEPAKLKTAGIDPELVDYLVEAKRRGDR